MEKHKQISGTKRAYVYCGYSSRNNYIRGLSHNLYSDYLVGIHKILAKQQDPDIPVLIFSSIGLVVVIVLTILT